MIDQWRNVRLQRLNTEKVVGFRCRKQVVNLPSGLARECEEKGMHRVFVEHLSEEGVFQSLTAILLKPRVSHLEEGYFEVIMLTK